MDFWTKLRASIQAKDSLLCVGLDVRPNQIPPQFDSVTAFGKAIVRETLPYACAYKPNIAFYEAMGIQGQEALRAILAEIPNETPVILDAKRNDISTTAAAYAASAFDVWDADAMTVTPYLGADGIEPFAAHEDRGLFVLCKTSNPSAGQIQDWEQDGVPLYQHVADLAATWSHTDSIGLVIGATYPEAIAAIRDRHPATWFLVPGIGAQGGDLQAVLQAGLNHEGTGLIINASRSVIYADDRAAAASDLRDRINQARLATTTRRPQDAHSRLVTQLATDLHKAGCLQFGEFTLASGDLSPVYVDMRRLVSYPSLLAEVSKAYADLLSDLEYDRIAAIPYAALPIGTAVSLQTNRPLIYPRKEAKSHGTRRAIEGEFREGETAVLLDDLISSGGSKLQAAKPLQQAGLKVRDVVVLIDREQGGTHDLQQNGLCLHAALTLREMVDALQESKAIRPDQAQRVRDYLAPGE